MSDDLDYIFLPKYGPHHPFEYGLVWCQYDGWVCGGYHRGIIGVEGVVE